MQLYGLKHLRLVRESRLDTKCLMAWNEDTLVLAFRGTASRQNAISDLKVGSCCEGRWLGVLWQVACWAQCCPFRAVYLSKRPSESGSSLGECQELACCTNWHRNAGAVLTDLKVSGSLASLIWISVAPGCTLKG